MIMGSERCYVIYFCHSFNQVEGHKMSGNFNSRSILGLRFVSFLFVTSILVSTSEGLNSEGLYLLDLKKGLGDQNNSLGNWNLNDETPCRWIGVNCTPSHVPVVFLLVLKSMNLSGILSPSIGGLVHLTMLDLSHNGLTGEIPREEKTHLFSSVKRGKSVRKPDLRLQAIKKRKNELLQPATAPCWCPSPTRLSARRISQGRISAAGISRTGISSTGIPTPAGISSGLRPSVRAASSSATTECQYWHDGRLFGCSVLLLPLGCLLLIDEKQWQQKMES